MIAAAVLLLTSALVWTTTRADAATSITIGNRVWLDANANGMQDDGETGAGGVQLELFQVTEAGNRLVATLATDQGGWWGARVPAGGCYRIEVAVPDGRAPTRQNAGNDWRDSDIDATGVSDRICSDTDIWQLDAGLVPRGTTPTVKIGNLVWDDTNANGIQESGEPGIPNVPVTIHRIQSGSAPDVAVGTVSTNSGGWWAKDVAPGNCYYATIALPDGYEATTPDATQDWRDSDLQHDGRTSTYCVNGDLYRLDIGLKHSVAPPPDLTATIYTDLNLNGVRDTGEPLAPEGTVGVWLTTGPDAPALQEVPGSGGTISIPGTFQSNDRIYATQWLFIGRTDRVGRISASAPPGSDRPFQAGSSVIEVSMRDRTNVDIGVPPQVTTTGKGFVDIDLDGTWDDGEPVAPLSGGQIDIRSSLIDPSRRFDGYDGWVGSVHPEAGAWTTQIFAYPGECLYGSLGHVFYNGVKLDGWGTVTGFTVGPDSNIVTLRTDRPIQLETCGPDGRWTFGVKPR